MSQMTLNLLSNMTAGMTTGYRLLRNESIIDCCLTHIAFGCEYEPTKWIIYFQLDKIGATRDVTRRGCNDCFLQFRKICKAKLGKRVVYYTVAAYLQNMVNTLPIIILITQLIEVGLLQVKRTRAFIPTRSLTTSKQRELKFEYQNSHQRQCNESEEPVVVPSELPKPKLDYRKLISEIPRIIENTLHRKSPLPSVTQEVLSDTYNQYKDTIRTINSGHHEQRSLGVQIQSAVQTNDLEKQTELRENARQLRSKLGKAKQDLDNFEQQLLSYFLMFPNDTCPSTPRSTGPVVLSTHGPPPIQGTHSRDHLSICKAFDLLDFDSGSLVTGSSWYYLLNEAALLETALTQYALSLAVDDGFTPVITPDVVRADIAARCGFAPRESRGAASQMYHIANQEPYSPHPELVLAGTAEIPLAGKFANRIHPSNKLPYKVVGVGHAFRSEAGASAESRGLYRVHQFTKVELFAVTAQDQSEEMMESMKDLQRKILEGLGLSFR